MASTSEQLADIQAQIDNLRSYIAGIQPNNLVNAALGDFIKYGCKVTEGSSNDDMVVAMTGNAAGDAAYLNPLLVDPPAYPIEYPNLASLPYAAFFSLDRTAAVATAPAAGTARYDIAFIYVGRSGAGFAITEGGASASVKADFDGFGLQTEDYRGSSNTFDPDLPVGSVPIARIYVGPEVTAITDAVIVDLRVYAAPDATFTAQAFADAAEASADAAEAAEINAETAEANAETAEANAELTRSYAEEWANKAEDTLVSAAAGGDEVDDYSALHHAAKANADATATAADVVQTGLDVVATAADVVQTGLDAVATAADVVQTGLDVVATAADAVATAADVVTAASHLASVEAIFDNFDDIYLGAYASDPTLDNDGNALVPGQVYWNSTVDDLRFYNGATWEAPSTAAATSAAAALASEIAADADAAQVAADLVATNQDTIDTAADVVQTGLDVVATAADVVQTGIDADSASASASAAAASYDAFDDRYLGVKTSDPTLDNDGNALVVGALYYYSDVAPLLNAMKVYNGEDWIVAYAATGGALLSANNLSDLANAATARTNLGVAIGTNVQAYSAVLAGTQESFTTALKGNYDTAYGWGNHAGAGYQLASGYTAADVLSKLLTVDGAASGLDADTLDGTQLSSIVTNYESYADAAVAAAIDMAPAALDTLNELAAALGDDADFAGTMTAGLAGKQPLDTTLTNFAGLAIAANKLPYGDGADTFGLTDFTAFARTLLDDASAAAARATLELDNTVTLTGTETLTNKRVTPRVGSTTSHATPTINTDNVDVYKLTAQAEAITSFTTNLSGTPTDAQPLIIQITGTAARAITWGASFESSAIALPTTTVTTELLTVEFLWNAVTSKWRCVAVTSTSSGGSGSLLRIIRYTTAGSGTWTRGASTVSVLIRTIAGGGSGASSANDGNAASGGGASGGMAELYIASAAASYAYAVGAGGAAKVGAGAGNDGSETTIAGISGGPGGGGKFTVVGDVAGLGGDATTPSGGDINVRGSYGAPGTIGETGRPAYGSAGSGGASCLGGAGGGGRGGILAGNGTDGVFGGGGGGAADNGTSGAGGAGCIEIWEYS